MGRTRCRYLQANAIGEKQQLFDARSFSTIYTFSSRSLSMRRHLSFDCGLAIGRRARDIYAAGISIVNGHTRTQFDRTDFTWIFYVALYNAYAYKLVVWYGQISCFFIFTHACTPPPGTHTHKLARHSRNSNNYTYVSNNNKNGLHQK